MNLINTKIITSTHDALWAGVARLATGCTPKPVLVITNEYEPGSLTDTQLKKMLETACQLTTAQYNVVGLKDGIPAAWYQLRELLTPKIIFLIGIMPEQLGISALFVLNSPNNFDDCTWLPTLSVAALEQNAPVKAQLWNNGMKPIFKDKKYGQF